MDERKMFVHHWQALSSSFVPADTRRDRLHGRRRRRGLGHVVPGLWGGYRRMLRSGRLERREYHAPQPFCAGW